MVTEGAAGAWAVDRAGRIEKVAGVALPSIVDTVGAGDGFAPVFMLGMLGDWPLTTQLARADAARAFLDRRPVDLNGCISEMLNLYRMQIDEKPIRLTTRLTGERSTVPADRDKLLQAVRNLIDNSLKYTPAGGTVSITSARTPGGMRVDFVNDGPGIPAAELPYVFERFFRAEYSRSRDAGGAGIGLAIVKQLIEAHGGQVGAASVAGETRIWFELPA